MASYRNAAEVLPPELLAAVQRYAAGEQIYIPLPTQRAGWGERSGTRALLRSRNAEIHRRHCSGETLADLAREYHLSYDAVRKIVRGSKQAEPIAPHPP